LLVSLDITPSSLLATAEDAGSYLDQWTKTVWRAGELLLGCLLAGGILVLPYWLIQRWRKTSRPQLTARSVKQPLAPLETATFTPPADAIKTIPITKTT
jgi:hypothetical protein